MARSRVGGTRGLLSGKYAQQVYTIRQSADGGYQQVISAVPEGTPSADSPTLARQRMIMSVVERAMGLFRDIVQHSYEGYSDPDLAVAEWSRENIKLVTDDVNEHWDGLSEFSYTVRGSVGASFGRFQISKGSLTYAWFGQSAVDYRENGRGDFYTWGFNSPITVREFKEYNRFETGDYYTMVVLFRGREPYTNWVGYYRILVTDKVADNAILTTANAMQLLEFTGNFNLDVTFNQTRSSYHFSYNTADSHRACQTLGWGFIRSAYRNGKWLKSTSKLRVYITDPDYRPYIPVLNPSEVWDSWYTEQS